MDTDIAEFFKTIIEHTSELIFLINESGLIIFAGQETNKKLEGKSFLDVGLKEKECDLSCYLRLGHYRS